MEMKFLLLLYVYLLRNYKKNNKMKVMAVCLQQYGRNNKSETIQIKYSTDRAQNRKMFC